MSKAKRAIRREIEMGIAAIVLLGGTATAWSTIAKLDSAVVTSGVVVVESNVKKVQHQAGGIVGRLNVKEGQKVQKDDLLVRLDDTQTKATLGIVMNDLNSHRLRFARLAAERDGKAGFAVPEDMAIKAKADAEITRMIEGERMLQSSRSTTRQGQKAQLTERIAQLRQEVKALAEQRKSSSRQLTIARDELKGLTPLMARNLVPKTRLTALEREIARAEGSIGEVEAKTVQAQGKMSETELQILQLDKDKVTEVAKELREAETKIGELQERKTAAEDQLKRVEIRAPSSGMVHQLTVHTVGGVINQTEPLMLIVPESDRLVVEVRINPQDIDGIHPSQDARVRFSAFNIRTTPEVPAKLFRLAGDLMREPQTGQTYYLGAVQVTEEGVQMLQGLKLLPGMPAEVFITTGKRTPASYLVKPLVDNMQRAFREK